MKIKYKIRLGFGLIFISILFAGSLSIFFLNRLSKSSKVILKNNYESLSFAREMRTVLDENNLPLSDAARSAFNKQLLKQENNVTENGEGAATSALRTAFSILKLPAISPAQQQSAEQDARVDLRKIEELNMQAIVRKTDAAQASVNNATLILGIIGCVTFLALFSFSVNISGFIAEPLITLTDGLGQISRKNYNHRLYFSKSDEFAEVSAAFNDMAENLKNLDQNNSSQILAGKQRIETIIEHVHDAVIVLNEKQEILFANTTAQDLLNLHGHKPTGKASQQFQVNNNILKSILESQGDNSSLKIAHDGKESVFQLESVEIFIPNITDLKNDEINIARVSAGKIYVLRNLTEFHEI
ncbi:MAG TPA: HAMP domain-containing protein [Bacteroidia bacterium]|nr:HAMP domain-containing protein [Bacteroidia bacterium]